MASNATDGIQPLPKPYGAGFEEDLGALEQLISTKNNREKYRMFWGSISWWGPMRVIKQSFGLLVFLSAFLGIVTPIIAPSNPWQILVVWLPLLFLALGPSSIGAEMAKSSADARFELSARQGKDYRATPGSDRIIESLRDSRRNSWLQVILGLFAVLMLTFSAYNPKASIAWNMSLLLAMIIGLGMSIHIRLTMDDVLNHADPLPFLALYAPTHHPTGVTPALSSLVRAHLDPVLTGEWDEWSERMSNSSTPGETSDEAMERLLLLLHLHDAGALSNEKLFTELGEFLDDDIMDDLVNHPTFNKNMLIRMIAHSRAWQPGMFRVLARLQGDLLEHSQAIADQGWRLDVEFESVCFDGQGHLFIALNNQKFEAQRVSIEVHVPGGQPETQTFRLEAPPCTPPSGTLALFSATGDDVVSWLPRYMCRGVFLWLGVAWESGESGLRTLQVTLRTEEGDVITSRMIQSKVHRRLGSGDRRRRRRLRRARKLGLTNTNKG